MRRAIAGLVWVCLVGCAFDAVEHSDQVDAGELLSVTLRLRGGGAATGTAAVCAGLPVGWDVEHASYTGSVLGVDSFSGLAVEDLLAANGLGTRPDVEWSCWSKPGEHDWVDASSGVVQLSVRVPADASGRKSLFWSLGTTGLTGELLSATATSTVRVHAAGHPLDGAADVIVASDGDAVLATPTGFMSIGNTGIFESPDGLAWSLTGDGLADVVGAVFGGETLWAWTDDALSRWTPQDAWQSVQVPWTMGMHGVARGDGLLVSDDSASALQFVQPDTVSARSVPDGAEPDGLAASGDSVVWRLWNRSERRPEVAHSSDGGVSWTTVGPPMLPRAVGQHDRVGVAYTGDMLWASVSATSTGAKVSLWQGAQTGDWIGLGSWPVGELDPTTTPKACDGRWVVGLPWGGWLAVDVDGTVSRHALGRSVADVEYICAAGVVAVTEYGRVTGVGEWVRAPDLTDLTLPVGMVGEGYRAMVGSPEWTTHIDGLPDGLTLAQGIVTGAPVVAGLFGLEVESRDVWDRVASASVVLTIDEADVEVPDDVDTDTDIDVDTNEAVESGTDVGSGDDSLGGDRDEEASVDGLSASGCSTAASPMWLLWPVLGLLLALRRRR